MLEFKQVEGSGPPMDIEVVTDDANAELADIHDMFDAADMYGDEFIGIRNFNEAVVSDEGLARFVIPGDEAAEMGDVWDHLGMFLEECNQKAIAAAEAEAS